MVEELLDDDWEPESPEALARRLDAWEAPYTPEPSHQGEAISPWQIFEGPKLDAMTSLRMLRDPAEIERYFEQHRDVYRNLRSVQSAIDSDAAYALEERMVAEQRQSREDAIARVKAASKYPVVRRDAELLKHVAVAREGRLPPRVRQVYALCIEQGLSANQCAQILGIGRETVRSHLRRLRAEVPAAWREAKTA